MASRNLVPSPSASHRTRFRWLRRTLLAALVLLLVLAGSGFTYQTIAREQDAERYLPPGQLVDVGGFRLHVHVMGEEQAGPTVLLEHGGGGLSPQWGWIQPAVAEFARVVAYDRPGLGWSEASPEPLTAEELAAALRTALAQVGVDGPYVIVGHSMGGLLARAFTQRYPEDVVGLVLVDPRPTSWETVFPEGARVNETLFRLLGLAARVGYARLTGFADGVVAGLPEQQAAAAVAKMSTRAFFEGSIHDARLGDSAAQLLSERERLGELPVIVLSAELPDEGFDPQARPRLNATHVEMAARSARGEHRVVTGANHYTIVTHDVHARQVTQAIRDVVELTAP